MKKEKQQSAPVPAPAEEKGPLRPTTRQMFTTRINIEIIERLNRYAAEAQIPKSEIFDAALDKHLKSVGY